jgi:hypothetical protein
MTTMQNRRFMLVTLIAVSSGHCHAGESPIIGVIEQLPVIAQTGKVSARPVYILTDQRLSTPTVFSGLQGPGSTLSVVCCYEIRNTTPTSLDTELAKYGKDPFFASQMKSIKGYRYIYVAHPTSDKKFWTPLMKTLAQIAANPDDGSPFSAAVVGAQFDKPTIPASFTANGVPMTIQTRSDTKRGRIIHTFTRGGKKVDISEDAFAD